MKNYALCRKCLYPDNPGMCAAVRVGVIRRGIAVQPKIVFIFHIGIQDKLGAI